MGKRILEVSHKQWKRLFSWLVFLNALVTYTLTMEPTVSFWDTGEYIATAAKLEIAHPPGAPLFQMIGAVFAILATNSQQIAPLVNYVSVVASAFTIFFLFLTIAHIVEGLLSKQTTDRTTKAILVIGSSGVGALAFTYSDSFWFNATETEVYALASCMMSLLLWMGLRWTSDLKGPRASRWLLLISFVIGLTFGVQFMGFLVIPSVVLLYYFSRYKKVTLKSFAIANLVALLLLVFVYKFSLTTILQLFAWGELFAVNQLGLPFNSGSILVVLGISFLFYISLRLTRNRRWVTAHTGVLCLLFLVLGFSSWLLVPLRASAHVGINQNDPSDARTLLAYYNREQYPSTDSPLFGKFYTDRFADSGGYSDDHPKYERNEALGRYDIVNDYKDAIQKPNSEHTGFLPRMWSEQHAANYHRYFGPLQYQIKPAYRKHAELRSHLQDAEKAYASGDIDAEGYIAFLDEMSPYITVIPPSFGDQVQYLLQYQLGYLYLRYLMWNFVGRQNDVQGRYDGNGAWLSGISFLDKLRLGSQHNRPRDARNKGRNTYFFLPLLLGLLGMVVQGFADPKRLWVLVVFFGLAGLGIQFYTNPAIFQPRARDYVLVGSFYAFAIWIGIGVYGLFQSLKPYVKSKWAALSAVALTFLAVPLLMGFQNWDDHDRSHRSTARASAKAYLDSTEKDVGALLFTIGDNDNFPLWYLQEIEGHRTDVRVMVTGYLATDWYIDQMKRKAYKSAPIPSQMTHAQYGYGTRDAVYYQALSDKRWNIRDFMNWITSDDPKTKYGYLLQKQGAELSEYPKSTQNMVYYPTHKIRVPVNKEKVLQNGLVSAQDAHLIVDHIDIDLPKSYLTKNRLIMLDILANNDWERPIYFSGGSFEDAEYLWMKSYLQLDGLAYKLVPIKTDYDGGFEMGRIDTDKAYEIVKQWDWGNSGSPTIYHDPQTRRQFGVTFRLCLARLVEALIAEGKKEQAKEIIAIAMQNIPLAFYEYYDFVTPFLEGWYEVEEQQKARTFFQQLTTIYQEALHYYANMNRDAQMENVDRILANLQAYQRNLSVVATYDTEAQYEIEEAAWLAHATPFDYLFK
ncbi:MAG: DUF2723 domain-containing protein [Bacteroidota bacterium]